MPQGRNDLEVNMIDRILNRLRVWLQQFFPERQIYHRSEGKVNYISLTPRNQMIAAASAGVLIIWLLYSTISVFSSGHLLSSQSIRAHESRTKVQLMLSEARAREASTKALLENRTKEFSIAANEFEQRLGTLKILLNHVSEPTFVTNTNQSSASGNLVMAAAASDPEPRQSRPLPSPVIDNTNQPMARLSMLKNEQDLILRTAEETTTDKVENLMSILQFTGLNTGKLLATEKTNVGGPYIAMSEADLFAEALDIDNDFSRRILRLSTRLNEAKQLEQILLTTPLANPVLAEHRRTSKFGSRIDPITGKPARHPGMDFGAFRLAPIGATSAGKVVYAGWKSGYGRFVEIDHGRGFRTRYAHMAKLVVKRGQIVQEGDKIGLMGSSGRSTGTHLHYEIWHNGKIYDPEKFLKAGLYVQQKK
ncbi:MAG: peptidoglycan DD-metalloendopeptidase family protein [Robiginitomaculum sp.]|nr:peptidoglycan DD-metalloendopeptidase family protein [Robiginitomaculum sp.]